MRRVSYLVALISSLLSIALIAGCGYVERDEFEKQLADQEMKTDQKIQLAQDAAAEASRVLEMPFGKVKFDPPYWTVEFNPTLDELRRLDIIAEELKNPSIGDDERNALVAESESIIEIAQRPTKYISGVVISKDTDAAIPTDINWRQLYEENFSDD